MQMFETTKNILPGEALRMFEQQAKYKGSKTTENYK